MPSRPVIALLTDFGLSDHYVGVMKGVMAGVCPEALTIDLTHDVPPQDVRTAAFELSAAWPYLPAGTVFLVVVDPGVGTSRRGIAARIGERLVVGPDNGVFDLVLPAGAPAPAVELTNPHYRLPAVSSTFEGRDRFAPAAAWLARGVALADLGNPIDLSTRQAWPQPHAYADRIAGEIMHVDRFGNLITNLDRGTWGALVEVSRVRVAGCPEARVVRTYGDAADGELVALFGSTGRLEIAVVRGSAAARLGAGRGVQVHVSRDA